MIKKNFLAFLFGLMLIQGYSLPILANEEEVKVMEDTSSELVEIEDFSEQENLEDNLVEDPTSIKLNTTIRDSLETRTGKWYTFEISSPGVVSLEFSHSYMDDKSGIFWNVEFYNEDLKKLDYFEVDAQQVKVSTYNSGIPAGKYFVKVRGGYNSSKFSDDEYTFKINFTSSSYWEKEPNDQSTQANSINLNTTYHGSLLLDRDKDWYTFNLNSAGYIELEFAHEYLDNVNKSWDLELYNQDFEILNEFDVRGTTGRHKDVKIGLDKGTYYIKLTTQSHTQSCVDYSLTVNFTSSNNWEVEPNYSASTATPLVLGKAKSAILENRDERDWFSIDLYDGDYSLEVTSSSSDIGVKNRWNVNLYNSDLTDVIKGSFPKNDEILKFSISNSNKSKAETYYLRVDIESYNYLRAEYSIVVKKYQESEPTLDPNPTSKPDPTPDSQPQTKTGSMYRLYNPKSGEHFYTQDNHEKDVLVSLGWNYEGIGWSAPNTSTTPVYRLYNKNAGDHHYTTDRNEKDTLVRIGWNDEGIGWYSDDNKGRALYRIYNPNTKTAGSHHYTLDDNEKNRLVSIGWKDEGIAWYGLK